MPSVIIKRLDGGLNLKDTPIHGEPNESPDCQNVDFDDLGAVKTRNGYSAFVSAAITTAHPIDMVHSYRKDDGTKQLLVGCGSDLWRMSGNTGVTVGSAQSVWTAETPIQAVNYQDHAWMSNGYVGPYKWNGTEFTKWGISAPVAPTVATQGTLGYPSGNYKYVLLGVNSNSVKGDYGAESTEISATTEIITVSGIPTFPISEGINQIAICRNTAGASGVYYVVTNISNGSALYADNHPDSDLTTLAPTDNGLPQKFTVMVVHGQRIFGASDTGSNPTYLYYSNLNDPEIFGSTDFLRIGQGDGLPIRALGILANGIIVFKNDNKGTGSVWYVYMPDTTPENWVQIRVDTNQAGQSPRVVQDFGSRLMYLNKNGVYDLSEQSVGSIKPDAISYKIEDEVYNCANAYMHKAVAVDWKNQVWVSVPYGATQATNNRVLLYDYVRGRAEQRRDSASWSRFKNMSFSDFAVHDGELYGGSSASDGYLYKLDSGTSDNGAAVDSYYTTMGIFGKKEHRNHTKVWRYALITVDASGDWSMELRYSTDFESDTGNVEYIDLDPGGVDWGQGGSDWGQVDWGPGITRKRVRIVFANTVSQGIQLKFATNTADEYFKVHELEIFYNLRSVRE